jgi:anti-sigma regulatory factor (Ser/Thr protein kinase)
MTPAGAASTLELANDPALLATARLFAASAARAAGCREEVAEDVRLAVSEACAAAMRLVPAGDAHVTIRLELSDDALRVTVSGDAGSPADAGGPDDVDLVKALFPDAAEARAGGRSELHFSAPRERTGD